MGRLGIILVAAASLGLVQCSTDGGRGGSEGGSDDATSPDATGTDTGGDTSDATEDTGTDAGDTDSDVTGDDGVGNDCVEAADGTPCDDSNECTTADVCESGICVGGSTLVCDEETGACTTGTCEPETGCVYTTSDDGAVCELGCFTEAACESGECTPVEGSQIQCPSPSEPCLAAWQCDPQSGQCTVPIFGPEGTDCDSDQDVCTLEKCDGAGECVDTGEVNTCAAEQANNLCWTWTCNKKAGCLQTLFLEGGNCEDNNGCTIGDTCVKTELGQEACVGTPVDTEDGNPCTDGKCVNGVVEQVILDGIACDPNSECSPQGVCDTGTCIPNSICECTTDSDCPPPPNPCAGEPFCDTSGATPKCAVEPGTAVACPPASKLCYENKCSPALGTCQEVLAPAGSSCDDGEPCTIDQTCAGGLCQGGQVDPCDDEDPCTLDTCEVSAGCEHTPIAGCGCTENCGEEKTQEFGAAGDVWIETAVNKDSGKFLIMGKQCGFPKKRSLVQFELSAIPKTATVTSATLSLNFQYNHGAGSLDRVVEVYRVLKPWNEKEATELKPLNGVEWTAPLMAPGFDFDPEMVDSVLVLGSGQPKDYVDWDVTSLVQKWVANDAENFGAMLRANNEDECGGEPRFNTKEVGDAAKVPILSVTWEE